MIGAASIPLTGAPVCSSAPPFCDIQPSSRANSCSHDILTASCLLPAACRLHSIRMVWKSFRLAGLARFNSTSPLKHIILSAAPSSHQPHLLPRTN